MNDIVIPIVNVLPGVTIISLLIYYYNKKKIQGLLWLIIGYIVSVLITLGSMYLPIYISDRAMSSQEMAEMYKTIGIVSLIANVAIAIGFAVVLSRYPNPKEDEWTPNQF